MPPPPGGAEEDGRWMDHALTLARRALGAAGENPPVGCVIVAGGRVIGRGWTRAGGRPHAEAAALDQSRALGGPEALRGATAYVTLEPCAHHARTGPCADALAEAGIARVVSTFEDPDPRVAGRGFARLRAAGVAVEIGLREREARRVAEGFLSRMERGRPFLRLKIAATLDGRIATRSGESRWITGPEARARAHLMRAESDVILVGAGTARADDPALDVRLRGLAARSPVRAVIDGGLSLPLTGRLVATARRRPLVIFHRAGADAARRDALIGAGAELVETPAAIGGALDLGEAMSSLAARGANRVLCEGGGRLAAALLAADLVDEIVWASAGLVIGADGVPSTAALGLERLADAPHFALDRVERWGPDVAAYWRRPSGAA